MFIRQISAKDFVQAMFALLTDAGLANEAFNWNIQTDAPGLGSSHGNVSLKPFCDQSTTQSLLKAIEENDFLTCTTFHLNLAPQGQPMLHFTAQPDGISGQFQIHNHGNAQRQLALLKGLREKFKPFANAVLLQSAQKDYAAAGLQEREVAVATLETQFRQLQAFMEKSAKEDRERGQALRAELEREYAERRSALEKEDNTRKTEFETHRQAAEEGFRQREKDFEERVKKFETQEAKYQRRSLESKIETALTGLQTPKISTPTVNKRWGVHIVVWLLGVLSAVAFGVVLYRELTQFDWHLMFAMGASFTTLVSTAIYYIRWNDRWFREHADLEFSAAKYKADMLRASWVAELSAEQHQLGEKAEIPAPLIRALTRNLFDASKSEASEHPMEQFGALLRSVDEVKVDQGGFSFKAKDSK